MSDKNIIEIVLKAVDKATKPIQDLNRKLDTSLKPARELTNQFNALGKATGISKLSKAWGEVENSIGAVKQQIIGTAQLLIGATTIIGGAFAFIAKSSIDGADGLLRLSKETGVSVEELQRLRFIASQTGSSADDLDTAIKKFTINMGLAHAGQGNLYAIMSKVNPEVLRQMLATKDNAKAFQLMLSVIGKLPNAQHQAALSQIAFGRGNLSLISTSKAGSEEIAALTERFKKIGFVTKEQAEQSKETADAWDELVTALKVARDTIVGPMLPALQNLAKTLTQFLIDNKVAIQEWGKEFAKRLPDILNALVGALKAVGAVLSPLISIFAFLGKHTSALNVALALLAEIFALKLAFGIYNVIKAFSALNLVILGTPIGWVILGLTALVAVSALVYSNWESITEIFSEAWEWISKVASAIGDLTSALFHLPETVLTKLGFTSSPIPVTTQGNGQAPVSQNASQSTIKVSFDNLPKGARVSTVSSDDVIDLMMGYAMQ